MKLGQYVGAEETLLRSRVCTKCLARRGVDGAERAPGEALACQARCPIFLTLPTLTKYVENLDSLIGSCESVVRAVATCCPTCGSDTVWRSTQRHGCRPDCPLRE